jgi:hypothetical protein
VTRQHNQSTPVSARRTHETALTWETPRVDAPIVRP